MFYTWDFMQKEISVTSKMFDFMADLVYLISEKSRISLTNLNFLSNIRSYKVLGNFRESRDL